MSLEKLVWLIKHEVQEIVDYAHQSFGVSKDEALKECRERGEYVRDLYNELIENTDIKIKDREPKQLSFDFEKGEIK